MATPVQDTLTNLVGPRPLQIVNPRIRWASAVPNLVAESVVNGLWYEILRQVFPFPQFIVAPEFWVGNEKADLMVLQVTANNAQGQVPQGVLGNQYWNPNLEPVFAFEGKTQGNMQMQGNAFTQAQQYFAPVRALTQNRFRKFGMAVMGNNVSFLMIETGQGAAVAGQYYSVVGNQVTAAVRTFGPDPNFNTGIVSFDVANNATLIDGILQAIKTTILAG